MKRAREDAFTFSEKSRGNKNKRQAREKVVTSSLILGLGRDITINCLLRCSRSNYGSLAAVNSSFRSLIKSGELYRLRRQAGIVENWVYFHCNLEYWEAFDPIRLRCFRLPPVGMKESFMIADKETLAVGTELLAFGRDLFSLFSYKYSLLTHKWTPGTEMISPRCLFASASVGHIAIIAGGCDRHGNAKRCAELYNSETGVWKKLPDLNKARKMSAGVFMDGKFYAVGGNEGGTARAPLTCAEVFDIKTKTWTVIPNMWPLQGQDGEHATYDNGVPQLAVVKNELYAADHRALLVKKYDKVRNSWSVIGTLPKESASFCGCGLAFRACGDKIIVIGGNRTYHCSQSLVINTWDPSVGPPQWKCIGGTRSGSFVYNCAVMGC